MKIAFLNSCRSFVLLFLSLAVAGSAQAAVTNVAWYRLGENDPGAASGAVVNTFSQDLVGVNHLKRIGSPLYTNSVSPGASNQMGSSLAVSFNGTNQYLILNNTLVSTAVNNFGIEAWVKPNTTNAGIIAFNGAFGNNGWGLYHEAGVYHGLFGGVFQFNGGTASPGTWAHVALVRDNGIARFYVNGIASHFNANTPNTPTGGFTVATFARYDEQSSSSFFNGIIDEVRVFTFAPGQFSTNDLLFNVQRVATLAASGVGLTSARLNGTGNSTGLPTTGWFEWGATTNYGNVTATQLIGSGATNVNFSRTLPGLTAGATYNFRAAVSNSLGVAYGLNQVFVTIPSGDINLITGIETWPHVTQNESAVWSHGNTIVVAYDDSRGVVSNPMNTGGGVSVSTNNGATFQRSPYLFNVGGPCVGNPSVFYSVRAGKWYVSFLSGRCSSLGIAQWESVDGLTWLPGSCVAIGTSMDHHTTWVDNNPGSPFYGRQYASFNDFNISGGAIRVAISTDDGSTWGAPITVHAAEFRRSVKVTGSLGTDGTVFVQTMAEGGGGLDGLRINFIYRTTNGGASWTSIQQNSTFLGPGRSVSGYFAGMYNSGYWREMGWGQPGVGPGNVVHYAYAARTFGSGDPGDIYYIRSADNGSTWSVPLKFNTDSTLRAQWSPSLCVNVLGMVSVSWYDERNTVGERLEYFGRISLDNGATWGLESAISDVAFDKPLQVDPSIQQNHVGTYNHAAFGDDGYGIDAFHAWTDGRVSINDSPQQDVFFDRVAFPSGLKINSIVRGTNGTITVAGIGLPNRVHSIQGSPDLDTDNFTGFDTVTPNASGLWQYNVGAPTLSNRFYRLSYP